MSLLPQFSGWNVFQSKHASGKPAKYYATRNAWGPQDRTQTLSADSLDRLAELITAQEHRDARRTR